MHIENTDVEVPILELMAKNFDEEVLELIWKNANFKILEPTLKNTDAKVLKLTLGMYFKTEHELIEYYKKYEERAKFRVITQ